MTQLAASGLIVLMLGAIQKKIFVWHTGFWGEKASGCHYDLMFVVMNLVILFTGGIMPSGTRSQLVSNWICPGTHGWPGTFLTAPDF